MHAGCVRLTQGWCHQEKPLRVRIAPGAQLAATKSDGLARSVPRSVMQEIGTLFDPGSLISELGAVPAWYAGSGDG